MKPVSVVFLTPEPPYPLHGGGAFRIASLVHYFARFAEVDLILFSERAEPAALPAGLVRRQTVIRLPVHGKGTFERWLRNGRRAFRGVPPLVDRLSGYESEVREALRGQVYDAAVVEHAWCASYVSTLKKAAVMTILDLHNIESVLHHRSAAVSRGLVAAGHRRFATAMSRLEAELLPQFNRVAVTSPRDLDLLRAIAPGANSFVYPNALPDALPPSVPERPEIAFSGNFEYHPNVDAVSFLAKSIWPAIQRTHPDLRLRLIGRGDQFISHLLPSDGSVIATGEIADSLSEIAAAQIIVAPVRSGSGTRIKILEAWKAARPVVATRLAAEGLHVVEGQNILFAESPAEFALAIDRLLRDSALRRVISEGGRQTFSKSYTWQAAWCNMEQIFPGNSMSGQPIYTK